MSISSVADRRRIESSYRIISPRCLIQRKWVRSRTFHVASMFRGESNWALYLLATLRCEVPASLHDVAGRELIRAVLSRRTDDATTNPWRTSGSATTEWTF